MKKMVAKVDESVKENIDYLQSKELEKQLEVGNNVLSKRTRYELENLLYMRFDIHKKHYHARNFTSAPRSRSPNVKKTELTTDRSWEYELDAFVEVEKQRQGMQN